MQIINLTPHDIIVDNGTISKTYKVSGEVARVVSIPYNRVKVVIASNPLF